MVRNAHIISRIEVTKVTWAFTIIFFAGRSSSSITWAKALSDLGGFFTCLKMRFAEVRYHKKCIYSYYISRIAHFQINYNGWHSGRNQWYQLPLPEVPAATEAGLLSLLDGRAHHGPTLPSHFTCSRSWPRLPGRLPWPAGSAHQAHRVWGYEWIQSSGW